MFMYSIHPDGKVIAVIHSEPRKLHLFFALGLSLVFGGILAGLSIDRFMDRQNYLEYAISASLMAARYLADGWISFFTNEPLWLLLNIILSGVLEPEATLRAYIFFSASGFSFVLLRKNPMHLFWVCVLLLMPQILKNYVVHLRQGVAIFVFFVGWNLSGGKRWLVIFLTPFIHSSFFIVLALLLLSRVMRWLKLSSGLQMLSSLVMCGVIAASLMSLAAALGARQGLQYEGITTNFSGLGFVFWLWICLLFAQQGQNFIKRYSFEISMIIFYLCSYFIIEVSARVFESALICVLLAGLAMKGAGRSFFLFSLAGYVGLSWLLRIGQPAFGFGV